MVSVLPEKEATQVDVNLLFYVDIIASSIAGCLSFITIISLELNLDTGFPSLA